jgi:WD40 repeat protein/serine/threonine protein kinase
VSDKTSESSANYVLLTRLADEFAARFRAGERPALKEYVDRHPELADDIREMFPAMVEIEQAGEDHQEATEQAALPQAPALQQLGDFRIIREVGKGGMGIVYEAEQVSLGRHVALKVLTKATMVDATAKRFEREAKYAAKLHHTNIVPVFGVGEQDGLPYYVMQFIQGLGLDEVLDELKKLRQSNTRTGTFNEGELRVSRKELSAAIIARSLLTGEFRPTTDDSKLEEPVAAPANTVCQQGPAADAPGAPASSDPLAPSSTSVVMPGQDGSKSKHRKQTYWRSVASIGVQVAQALEYAHKQGVQHRDIKPSNLLLDTQATVWLTDFGLAKADDQQALTHTGDILGTLRYMPPEAFEGKTDARSDIYSLGLTLYEMLAFRPGFNEKERKRLIRQVTHEEPRRLRTLNRQVPRDLETIVHKATGKDPKKRYASAAAFAEDLQRFLEDQPIKARPVSASERLWRWCRRNPLVAGLTAALLLVFLAGFAGVAWKWQAAEREKLISQIAQRSEAVQRAAALAQAQIATREADRSRRLLYASDMSLAYQAWEAGDTARVRDLLEEQRPSAGQQDLRGFEWRYLRSVSQDESRQTLRGKNTSGFRPGHIAEGGVGALALALDGKTLATCEWDHSTRIWDIASQRHVRLQGQPVYSAAFAPDGKILALAEMAGAVGAVRLWDVDGRCERATLQHASWVWSVAIAPQGNILAAGCEDHTIVLWDVGARQEVCAFRGHTGPIRQLAFSSDGRTLASGSMDATIRLWDVAARRPIAPLRGHTKWVTSLSFSPDGKLLASASADGTVRLWDTVTRQEMKIIRDPRTLLSSVAFAPDGRTVATGGADGTVRVWNLATTEAAVRLRGHTAPVTAVVFAPDGRTLVSASRDGTVKLWDTAAGPKRDTLSARKSWVTALAASPDGKTLAVTSADQDDHTIKLWDLASRRPRAILESHTWNVLCLSFSPDGQTLASGSDREIRIWDVATKRSIAEFQHEGRVGSVDFSPDGKLLAASGLYELARNIHVWEIASRREVALFDPGNRVRFTPDGKLLAASSGNTVRLWKVGNWENVAIVRADAAEVTSFAFAADGRTLAIGDAAGTLRVWDVADTQQIAGRRGHASGVSDVAFAPDGRRLATSGGDGTVKLWDTTLLREVASVTYRETRIERLAFAPDGNTLVLGGSDGTVRIWQAPAGSGASDEPAKPPGAEPLETFHLFSLELAGSARATRAPEGNGQRIEVSAVDGTLWHAQLTRWFSDIQEGATYTVRFRAKADVPCSIGVSAMIGEPDYHNIGLEEPVPLTDEWQTYEYEFQATDIAALNTVHFYVGQRVGTFWIADFTLASGPK